MKRQLLVLMMALMISITGYSQMLSAYVSGYVTGATTGFAIPNHPVMISDSLSGTSFTVLTNANGYFSQPVNVTPGTVGFFVVFTNGFCGPNDVYYSAITVQPNAVGMVNFVVCENATNPGSCQAEFSFQQVSSPACPLYVEFTDLTTSTQPVINWFWSFGDSTTAVTQNPAHCYQAPGTYSVCLTILTADSCTSTACHAVTVGNPTTTYSLSGNVFAGGQVVQNGIVLLMGNGGYSATANLSNNGWYNFPSLLPDYYIVLAIPMDSSLTGYVPTYHDSALFWNSATIIDLQANATANVHLQSVSTATGPGTIGGTIVWNGNTTKCIGFTSPLTKSAGDVAIILTDENNQLQRFTASNTDGSFQISNLPYGNYIMHIEIPGLYMEPFPFTLNETNSNLNGFVVDVDFGTIVLLGMEDFNQASMVRAYPNPVNDVLTLSIPETLSAPASIQIFDPMGKLIDVIHPTQTSVNIQTSGWQSGLYYLQVHLSDGQDVSLKVVK